MLSLGQKGEARAARYLKRRGYRILEMNYKSPTAEVDIVAIQGETIVFVEVKTRKNDTHGSPLEAVGDRKQAKLREAALFYMSNLKQEPQVRFDVISIMKHRWSYEIEHIEAAF